jgi:hypothetical protein
MTTILAKDARNATQPIEENESPVLPQIKSLNREARRRALMKITQENKQILQRL